MVFGRIYDGGCGCVCVRCRAWILLPRESLSQNAIVYFLSFTSFFFFMLRHCQAKERMVCAYAFASKQFKYVHEARSNTLNEVVKRMYGICVAMPFVSGGWKRYQRQKRTLNKWLETNDIHYLISSFGLRFYFSLSRIVIQHQKPKRRKKNSTERRTISIGCDRLSLCVTSSTHFSHIYLHRQEQFDNAIASIQSIKL